MFRDNPVNEEAVALRNFLEPMADYSLRRSLLVVLEPCSYAIRLPATCAVPTLCINYTILTSL